MIKKISKPVIVSLFFIFFVLIIALIFGYRASNDSKILDSTRILPVETLAFNPTEYPGFVGTKGTVTKIMDNKTFLLGCQDACVSVPINYNGQSPDLGQEVIIYGKLIQQNGKYIFQAETLKSAN